MQQLLSIIIPLYKGEAFLENLVCELESFAKYVQDIVSIEVIFVDDGSPDKTFECLRKISSSVFKWKAIRLSRNFKSYIAILAGIKESSGDYITVLPQDLQESCQVTDQMLVEIQKGYDVVWAIRNNRVKILKSSLFVLCVSLLFFFLPWLIQFIISPATFSIVSKLGKSHLLYGSYLYKYMTIVQPEVYGYASVNESIKQLIGVCEGLQEQSTCIKEVLISHPLATFQHYITKLMAINDQVYLFPYITNFYTPFRYLWRTINCVFLASSFIGFIILTFKVIRNKKEYLFQTLCLIIIVASCLLPLINSVPEERFGLTFHPLFAICTSYFINTYKEGKNRYSRLMQLMGFTIILSLLFQFSCNIESTFTLRLNG